MSSRPGLDTFSLKLLTVPSNQAQVSDTGKKRTTSDTHDLSNCWLTVSSFVCSFCLMSFQGVWFSLVQMTKRRINIRCEEALMSRTGRTTRQSGQIPSGSDTYKAYNGVAAIYCQFNGSGSHVPSTSSHRGSLLQRIFINVGH